MNLRALVLAASLFATTAQTAPVVLLASPVRVVAEVLPGTAPGTARLELSVQHGGGEFR